MTLEKCMLFAEEYTYSPKENDLFYDQTHLVIHRCAGARPIMATQRKFCIYTH